MAKTLYQHVLSTLTGVALLGSQLVTPADAAPRQTSSLESLVNTESTTPYSSFYEKYPGIKLSGRLSPARVKRITRSFDRVPEKVRNSVKEIVVYSKLISFILGEAGGDNVVRINMSPFANFLGGNDFTDLLYHEAAHCLTFNYEGSSNEFIPKWKHIAGDVYGTSAKKKHGLAYKWLDGSRSPRHGCVTPYGSQDLHEDIATFVEYVDRPSFFKPLLDKTSSSYDPRYQQKLDLLLEYGFVDRDHYDRIMNGVKGLGFVK